MMWLTRLIAGVLRCLPRRLRTTCLPCRSFRSRLLLVVFLLNVIFIVHLFRGSASSDRSTALDGPVRDVTSSPSKNRRSALSLQELDKIVIVRKYARRDSSRADAERCDGLTGSRPAAEELEKPLHWQTVVGGVLETFVFAAYYDPRTNPPTVKILGISSGIYAGPSSPVKFCQLWYEDESAPVVTVAEYLIVPETHDRKYAASFHVCRLHAKNTSVPFAASLVRDRCQTPKNVLRVVNNRADEPPSVNFTVCVTPFNLDYDNFRQLVEFVEVNRMFGADRFVFYNYTTGSRAARYVRHYVDAGIAELVPWRVPVAVNVWPPDPKEEPEIHYFAQLASLNDCLYRAMFRSRFVVFTDLDEVIVPRRRDRWIDMLDDVSVHWQQRFFSVDGRRMFPGAYLVQNVFFRTNWPSDERANASRRVVDLDLLTLLKTTRETHVHPWYSRSKYIVWSRATSMVSVHSVLDFVDDSRVMHVQVEDGDALLHHYRVWQDEAGNERLNRPVKDRYMHRYYDAIVERAAAVHDAVGAPKNS